MQRAQDWLREAEAELAATRDLLAGGHWSWCCFTAQQSAEKAIKALAEHFRGLQTGHNLNTLLQGVSVFTPVSAAAVAAAGCLNRFYNPGALPARISGGSAGRPVLRQRRPGSAGRRGGSVCLCRRHYWAALRLIGSSASSPRCCGHLVTRLSLWCCLGQWRKVTGHNTATTMHSLFSLRMMRNGSPTGSATFRRLPLANIDVLPYSRSEWQRLVDRPSLIALEALADGVALWDRGAFTAGQQRLRAWEAQGVVTRTVHGWQVSPRFGAAR